MRAKLDDYTKRTNESESQALDKALTMGLKKLESELQESQQPQKNSISPNKGKKVTQKDSDSNE